MKFVDKPISSRYLSQDDRISIAGGFDVGEPEKSMAARIGKRYQAVYREIGRNKKRWSLPTLVCPWPSTPVPSPGTSPDGRAR